MNVSRRWLEEFLRRPLEANDLARRLTMLGAAVDAIEPLHPGLEQVVIGLVESVRQHPNADRLSLCVVNAGSGQTANVVCGAPNVTAGKKYPFARVGTTLPGGLKLEKRKIRGETSEGMLCSAKELGLGTDHEGILELDTDAAPGTPLLEAIPLADDRLVLDISPSRPDLLGHKGIARELAHSFAIPFRLPTIPGAPAESIGTPRREAGLRAEVDGVATGTEDPAGCPRFLGAVLRGVKVAPSPRWLADRLTAVGVRPINNVVDATNYVMFELNQPMHAYDLADLKGPEVVARRAWSGEKLVTLDGVERSLTTDMTVIADATGAIGVAGVMGAAHVEVKDSTTDVFLECAYFDPRRVRRTRRTLNLSTEASQRFERGIDRWGGADALRRCIEIIQATAGGTVSGEPVDVWPEATNPPRLFLRTERVKQVLGVALSVADIEKYLVAIGCTVLNKPQDHRLAVDVPGWRPDLATEIDLVEEVARIHGYDNFPTELRPFRVGLFEEDPVEVAAARVRRGLVGWGLFEAQSLSFGTKEDEFSVPLMNPLSAEDAFLRRSLAPGLNRSLQANWSRHVRDVRLFEIGTVFRLGGPGERPHEERRVAGVVSGARSPAHWTAGGTAPDYDQWDLKSLFEAAVALAVPGGRVQVDTDGWVAVAPEGGRVGRAGPLGIEVPPWAAPPFGFEVTIDPSIRPTGKFEPLPVVQSAERDVALVLPPGISSAQVIEVLRNSVGTLLESAAVFDEYKNPAAGHGRSVAFHLVFRAADRTLRDAEVDAAVSRAVTALEGELGAKLRTS
ncbi:MAG TPA: phenylalanine--tRNA ligase subunit beta [Gemmatimonadales bacterium]